MEGNPTTNSATLNGCGNMKQQQQQQTLTNHRSKGQSMAVVPCCPLKIEFMSL